MSRPEFVTSLNTPEKRRKLSEATTAYFASGTPQAEAHREQARQSKPSLRQEVGDKIKATMKERGLKPPTPPKGVWLGGEQGGNGRGLTEPQALLASMLGEGWEAEATVSWGYRVKGLPNCYHVDLLHSTQRLIVEIDGQSHKKPEKQEQDQRKGEWLTSLGWTVLRFTNREVLRSGESVVARIQSHFTT